MAPPSLAEIGEEGFRLIDQFCSESNNIHYTPKRIAPSSLAEIGEEGFCLIDQFCSKKKSYHQQPCTHHKPENPLVTEKSPVSSQSQLVYHPSQHQLIAFGTVNPSYYRRGYVYQYPSPNLSTNPMAQDYVGGADNNNRRRDQAAVPSKEMDGGETQTGETKYSGKWKKWNVWVR